MKKLHKEWSSKREIGSTSINNIEYLIESKLEKAISNQLGSIIQGWIDTVVGHIIERNFMEIQNKIEEIKTIVTMKTSASHAYNCALRSGWRCRPFMVRKFWIQILSEVLQQWSEGNEALLQLPLRKVLHGC